MAASAPINTPRMRIEHAVVEAIEAHMAGSHVLVSRKALAKVIVDRITSAEYAHALRELQSPPPHPFNKPIRNPHQP